MHRSNRPEGSTHSSSHHVVSVPVEAADISRRKRRTVILIGIVAILVAATAGILYNRSMNPIRAQESYDAGVRLFKVAQYQQAILAFDRATSLKPDFAEAFLFRGKAFMGDSQIERATRDFSRVIELRPHDPQPLIERGLSFMETRDYQAAAADATRAIDLDNHLAPAFNLRGTAVRAQGDPRGAIRDFDRAVQLAPVEINYYERAATYQMLGEHRLAIADFTELLALRPTFPPVYFARAKSKRAIGDIKGADEDRRTGRLLDGH